MTTTMVWARRILPTRYVVPTIFTIGFVISSGGTQYFGGVFRYWWWTLISAIMSITNKYKILRWTTMNNRRRYCCFGLTNNILTTKHQYHLKTTEAYAHCLPQAALFGVVDQLGFEFHLLLWIRLLKLSREDWREELIIGHWIHHFLE